MKLLFDHHLSPRLTGRLADLFPDSSHVWLHGLDQADDRDIWEFARQNGFTLVTKDSDFGDLIPLRGFPPKVIWLRIGNCATAQGEQLIRQRHQILEQFDADPQAGVLELL
jgi:predicted nuclease of predicted toxin-antitoxin system